MSSPDWPTLVAGALAGELVAVEALVRGLQDRIYGLALRFLWTPQDAEDATQEILIRIITRLASFEGRSEFTTWAHRVAVNHLLNCKKSRGELAEVSFEALTDQLVDIRPRANVESELDEARQRAQIELACLHGMLLCLAREQRMALLLGTVLEVDSADGAALMEVSPQTYRKRLSRAKRRLGEFLGRRCGLANPNNSCRCEHWVGDARASMRLQPYLTLGAKLERAGERERLEASYGEELAELEAIASIYRRRNLQAPMRVLEQIRAALSGRDWALLRDGPVAAD